jgi:hypothetical protein
VVLAARPVFLAEVAPAETVPITAQAPEMPVFREIRNPVSLFELSVQLSATSVDDAAVAVRFSGGSGFVAAAVVALARLEKADSPVGL